VSGTWKIENGELSAETTATPWGQRVRANGFTFGNHSVHVKIKWVSGTYFEAGPYVRGQPPNEPDNGYMTFLSAWTGDPRDRISKMSAGSETTISGQGTTNPSKNVWYTYVFKLYGNKLISSITPLYTAEITGTDNTFSSGTLSLFSWSATAEHAHYDNLFVCKYVYPEPSPSSWGVEETGEYVVIDQAFVSDDRADVGSVQTVGFHAKWNNNGSDIVGGKIYVNNTEYITNATGWINFITNSPTIGNKKWIITGVNCNGITFYMQTAPAPSIIWDQIKITDGGTIKPSILLGETTTIWFKATYEYDNTPFTSTNGILYTNDAAMSWSTTNNRWEYNYKASTTGAVAFSVTNVSDNQYRLTAINDITGTKTVHVSSSPFSIISNSTITELAFNSTSKTISFTANGKTGTMGYTNVTIPKTLIENITELQIYIDGEQIDYVVTATEYTWIIHFTYHHSTHRVSILLSSTNASSPAYEPPYEATTILSEILAVTIAAIMLIHKRKRKNVH